MKILWFSNTPANANEYYNRELKGTGGWLKALNAELQNYVELHIAFYGQQNEVFKYQETTYYSIKRFSSQLNKAIRILNPKPIDQEDLFRYLKIIEIVKPDIIHIHGTENPFACIIPHTNIPVVISIQGIITSIQHQFFSGIDRKYLHIKDYNLSSLRSLILSRSFRTGYKPLKKMQKIESKNLKFAENIMGRTAFDRRTTKILAPKSNYYQDDRVLREGFYLNQWKPHSDSNLIIHTTCGNSFYKGFETLCLALNELNNVGFNCVWQVAGIKEDDLIVKVVKKMLNDHYPKSGLRLLGNLNETKLAESLLEADIYVSVSHIDNSPNSLAEAMILGMPCIASFVGGTGSMIKDGEEGVLVQNGDPWVLAGAIIELFNNKENATLMGANARKTALKRHDKRRIVSDLVKSYQEIIRKHPNNLQ